MQIKITIKHHLRLDRNMTVKNKKNIHCEGIEKEKLYNVHGILFSMAIMGITRLKKLKTIYFMTQQSFLINEIQRISER